MRRLWQLAVMLAVLVPPAHGNDSTATLAAGGLVYTSSASIRIDREDLLIGEAAVHVAYDFTNTGTADITTLVAFPLPLLSFDQDSNYAISGTDPVNFMDFRVQVDGRPVTPQASVRVARFGIDLTAVLAKYGIPPVPGGGDEAANLALDAKLKALPPAARAELEQHGLIDWSSAFGANNEPLPSLHWDTSVAFYWFQTFPAGKTVHVEHDYRPVPGYFFVTRESLRGDELKAFCPDNGFRSGVGKRLAASGSDTLQGADVQYILTTANNWLGPIGQFRLVVDKGSAGHILSTCWNGLKRLDDRHFVFEARDFQPEGDLRLLLVKPLDQPPAP